MKKLKLKKSIRVTLIILVLSMSSFFVIKNIFKNKNNDSLPVTNTNNDNQDNIKEEKQDKVKLTLVGDFLFEQPYYDALDAGEDKNLYFSLVSDYFKNDDLSIGNMEVVIGNDSLTTSGTGYNFCAPEYIGDLVSTLDLEVMATANNHAFDRGAAGVISTIDYFKNNTDILTIGTYKEESDKDKLNILEINNIKLGILAYTMSTNVKPSKEEKYMVSYYKEPTAKNVTVEDKERISNDIKKLKQESDVIIVLMHWGNEFTYEVNDTQKELANFLNQEGVDIIVGSHSHNIQPIEWIEKEHKTLVYYSLGNFVSADGDIPRTTQTFNNAYQVGLLSQLDITKENNNITISNIITEPIINYYDANLRNFMLIPYSKYDSYEINHYRYKHNFNKNFIDNMYESVIAEEFR